MKPRAIIFDFDWVLCHLKPESERNNHTWDELPIKGMLYLIDSIDSRFLDIIVLTWRKEKYRNITSDWLYTYGIPFKELIMQEWHTAKKNHVFKREKLLELKEKYDILCVVDDNPDMSEVCKDLWINLLKVEINW